MRTTPGPKVDRAYLAHLISVEARFCAQCQLGEGLLACARSLPDGTRTAACPLSWTNQAQPSTRLRGGLPGAETSRSIVPDLASHLGP
jgi:hypothetical protein